VISIYKQLTNKFKFVLLEKKWRSCFDFHPEIKMKKCELINIFNVHVVTQIIHLNSLKFAARLNKQTFHLDRQYI